MKILLNLANVLLVSLLVISSGFAGSTTNPALKDKMQVVLDDYFKKYNKTEHFTAMAASVLIPHDKGVDFNDVISVVTGSMGLPPYTQKINQDDLFDIGSITKSFTAVILLQLQAEGELSLDDHLGKWLPQYKNWKEVSLRQLLNMTSGIPNYSEDAIFLKKMYGNLSRIWSNEELISYAHPEQPLKINKDSLYEYCNTNYILAAMIIEKITHDTFESQIYSRIINQKGYLPNTYYPAGIDGEKVQKAIADRKLHGYFLDVKTKKEVDTFDNSLTWAGAAGAVVATTRDVAIWVQLLYHGILISPDFRERSLKELESVVSLKTGKSIPKVSADDPKGFGLGVGVIYDDANKQTFWFYIGSTLGFRVAYIWNPCNDVTTVVAINSKAGEGSADSKEGNHIIEANMSLYNLILQQHPELQCKL